VVKDNFLDYIYRISSFYKEEICGFICSNSIFFLENISSQKKTSFLIDPNRYFKVLEDSEIDFCFHSHYDRGPEPSEADIEISNTSLIPFLIVSVPQKKFCIYKPSEKEAIYFSNSKCIM